MTNNTKATTDDLTAAAELARDDLLAASAPWDQQDHVWLSALDAYAAAIRAEQAARYEARVEAIIWMSGSADFGPEGQAHAGWVKVRDGVLAAALAALEHEEVT